jgi:hypothetical protein
MEQIDAYVAGIAPDGVRAVVLTYADRAKQRIQVRNNALLPASPTAH